RGLLGAGEGPGGPVALEQADRLRVLFAAAPEEMPEVGSAHHHAPTSYIDTRAILPQPIEYPQFYDEVGGSMGELDGRVVVITGAGRGLGRTHALLMAAEGARVVVNDLGTAANGVGRDDGPAQTVAEETPAAGGEAVANTDDVTDMDGAKRLVQTATDTFGDMHVLVANAGILRDRSIVN